MERFGIAILGWRGATMSLKFVKAFEFLNQDTFLHRLDPRTKMIITLSLSVPAMIINAPLLQGILFLLVLPLIILGKIVSKFKMGLDGLYPFIILILILNTYLISFNSAFVVLLRVLILMGAFSILMQTTSPESFSYAFVKLGVPYEYAITITIAFRFIPTLANDLDQIKDAQYSRGHSFSQKGIFAQLKALIPLFIPLIISSIRRAYALAEALEARAFGAVQERTEIYDLKMRLIDYLMILLFFGVSIGFIYFYFVYTNTFIISFVFPI